MKRIVICCDGTWNRVDQESGGKPCPTNVVKLAVRLAKRGGDTPQLLYYDQGVGTGNLLDRYTGGAFGDGLEENIWDAYRFLIANYEPGDALYFFGFSRGAFTARSIVGMIRKCGILERVFVDKYAAARALYRTTDRPDDQVCRDFRQSHSIGGDRAVPIEMIGVWDTVGALGIPVRGLRSLTAKDYEFHDTELSGTVLRAYHALAIDERREPFLPTLWDAKPKSVVVDGVERQQIVEQVWFPGVHTDVGGGYPESGLSDITLQWMIDHGRDAGLVFDDKVMEKHRLYPDPSLKAHDSKRGLYALTKGVDREIGRRSRTTKTGQPGADDPTQSLHESVHKRLASTDWRPPGLIAYLRRMRKCPQGHPSPNERCPEHGEATTPYEVPV